MVKSAIHVFNDFHGTSTSFLGVRGATVRLYRRTVARIRRDLCGIPECLCSGPLGLRGDQPEIEQVVFYSCGSVDVEVSL